ncbi:MAG: ABC transporter substrate-binding protein [Pseudomonadota bacterium]
MTHRRMNLPQYTLPRRSFLAGSAALAAFGTGLPRMTLAQTAPSLGARDPKSLVVLVDATIENLDPATNLEWAYGLRPIYETLTTLDGVDTLSAAPALAESWSSNEEKTEWTFVLRAGATFHDGTPCDAAAVKAAITRTVLHPWGLITIWTIDDPENQISVVDPRTLTFSFPEPRPIFDVQVAGQYGAWIPSPTAAAENSAGDDDVGTAFLQANPVGTGPYVLGALDPGQDATFTRNPSYDLGWTGEEFDTVITKSVPLSATRKQLLEAGEADIVLALEPEDVVALREDPGFVVTSDPTFTVQFFAFATDGVLADPKARQGLAHAFDHDAYIAQVVQGVGDKPVSVFPSLVQGVSSDSQLLPFDLERAKTLLAEGGVPEGSELTLAYYTGFGDVEAQLYQAWLAQCGITLTLQELSFPAFLDAYFGDGAPEERPDIFYFSWWPSVNHPYNFAWSLFSADSIPAFGNTGRYANAEASELIDTLYQAVIDDAAAEKVQRISEIVTKEDPAWLPTVQERTGFVTRADITGLVNNPIYVATLDFYNLRRQS